MEGFNKNVQKSGIMFYSQVRVVYVRVLVLFRVWKLVKDGDRGCNAGDLQARFFSENFLHSEPNTPGRYYESMSLNLLC